MNELLGLSEHLPEIELAAGDVLAREGGLSDSVWVLVSGSLSVIKGDTLIHTLDTPGSVFGEVSVLLDSGHSASVVAASPTTVRWAEDGPAFLVSDPAILLGVASGLAERLDLVTTYLADLRHQYTGSPGLDMVSDVLGQLVRSGPADEVRPGSAREPDPEY